MSTRHVRLILAAATTLCMCGCALLPSEEGTDTARLPWQKADSAETDAAPVRLAAGLEIGIIRRPANDVRIRKLVWEQLDELGPMTPESRRRLNQSGFHVGVAANSGSWALQSLARDGQYAGDSRSGPTAGVMLEANGPVPVGHRFTLLPGGSSRLELQPFVDLNLIPTDEIPELNPARDLSNLKCVVELTVEELDGEWVLLQLLPQIHVGSRTQRLSVDVTGEQLPVRQRVIPLYEQQCRIRLHRGEVAVIGTKSPDTWNAGRLFFAPDSSAAGQESILLIRLEGIDRLRADAAPATAMTSRFQW